MNKQKQTEGALHETNSQLSALLEAIPDVVYFKDVQGRNLVVNKAYEELLGLRREEILGKTDEQLLSPDLAEQCRRSDEKVIKRRKPIRVEEQTTDDKGKRVFFDTIKSPVFDDQGNIRGLVGVSRDITERKRAEEALKKSREQLKAYSESLEKTVKERTKELSQLVESYQEFVAHINHELRTPLSIIKAVVEMRQENDGLSSAERLSLVDEKVDQTTRILKNLALVSRFDIGQERIWKTKFKLKGLINEALEDVIRERCRECPKPEVKISCPEKIKLDADRVKLGQVLTNLLGNAIVHANGQARIFLKAAKKKSRVQIVVEDNNPSIPKKDYQKVFEKFYRGRKSKRRSDGLGLGLYICQKLVELMGGKIWVESKRDVGNRFVVQLPIS